MVGLAKHAMNDSFFKRKQPKMRVFPKPEEQRNKKLNKIVTMQQSLSTTYGPEVHTLVNPGKIGSVIEIDSDTFARLYGD